MKSLTVKLDEVLLRQAKSAVALPGTTMPQFVSAALRAALPTRKQARK